MNAKIKAGLALVSLVIGMFLLIEGSRMTDLAVDLALVVVGAVLTLAYPPLMGNYLEVKLKAPRNVTLMPMLLVLGAVLIYQGVLARALSGIERGLFAGLGIALVVGSALMIVKAKAKKSQPAIVVTKSKKSRR
jgi:hypothetical protein